MASHLPKGIGLPTEARSIEREAHRRASRYGGQPSHAFMSEGWCAQKGTDPYFLSGSVLHRAA